MNDEMKEVVTCKCGQKEYYGMMHWRDGKQICRKCIFEIWQKESSWKPLANDHVFPLYSDGKNYVTKD